MRSYLTVFVVAALALFSTQAGAQQRGPRLPKNAPALFKLPSLCNPIRSRRTSNKTENG
jgi:hypothetical protein